MSVSTLPFLLKHYRYVHEKPQHNQNAEERYINLGFSDQKHR